jgi:hypothetical protein
VIVLRAILVALSLAMFACLTASTDDASLVLQRTAGSLGEISSGTLDMRFEMSAKDQKPGGFELEGPFSLRSAGHLPVVRFEHTRLDGDEEAVRGTFVSTGETAYVVRDGKSRRVPEDLLTSSGLTDLVRPVDDGASGSAAADQAGSGLGRLNIDGWIDGRPEISAGGLVGGVDTDKVTADLDVGVMMDGLIQLGRSLGGGVAAQLQPLDDTDRARVRRAVTEAKLETWSGKDDRLLRKLIIDVVFGLKNKEMAEKMPLLSEARIKLEAAVTDINDPVKVEAPDADE